MKLEEFYLSGGYRNYLIDNGRFEAGFWTSCVDQNADESKNCEGCNKPFTKSEAGTCNACIDSAADPVGGCIQCKPGYIKIKGQGQCSSMDTREVELAKIFTDQPPTYLFSDYPDTLKAWKAVSRVSPASIAAHRYATSIDESIYSLEVVRNRAISVTFD
jgi:hypothetical protein